MQRQPSFQTPSFWAELRRWDWPTAFDGSTVQVPSQSLVGDMPAVRRYSHTRNRLIRKLRGKSYMADISASLLRRIAEAADGHRTGEPIWVVAEDAPPHDAEVFDTAAEADAAAQRDGWSAHGPYRTPRDDDDELITVLSVRVRLSDGTEREIGIESDVDALFFSRSAVEKFAVPYYAHVGGVERAAAILGTDTSGTGHVRGHDRNTRWLPK